MSTIRTTTYDEPAVAGKARERDRSRDLFGRAMGLVAVTVAFTALGAYFGRDLSGITGLLLFIGALACILGLNVAVANGREQLAIGLLFGLGLVIGLAVAPVVAEYAKYDLFSLSGRRPEYRGVSSQAAAHMAACQTRRDLSSWARTLFWARSA